MGNAPRSDGRRRRDGAPAGGPQATLGLSASMRARDVSRVRDEDLVEAERKLVVRRAGPPPAGPGQDRARRS